MNEDRILQILKFIKNINNMVPLEKRGQLKLLIFVFQNQITEILFRQKKLLLILKILLTRGKILFNILASLVDQYMLFLHT